MPIENPHSKPVDITSPIRTGLVDGQRLFSPLEKFITGKEQSSWERSMQRISEFAVRPLNKQIKDRLRAIQYTDVDFMADAELGNDRVRLQPDFDKHGDVIEVLDSLLDDLNDPGLKFDRISNNILTDILILAKQSPEYEG